MARDPIPVACTLEPAAMPDRVAAWRLLQPSVRWSRLDGGRLEAGFADEATAELERLVEAERSCCAWATWTVRGATLSVEGPADACGALAEVLLGVGR